VIKKWIKYIAVYAAVTFAAKGLIGYVKHRIRYGRDIAFLNFALALEKQQTVYYKVQYDYLKNDEKTYHLAVGLDRASKVEKDHVDKINDAFYDIGLKPPKYTDVAYTTGIVTGELLGRMSPKKVLQALVWIEQKAIDHYHKAAKTTRIPELKKLYMENLVDEEFHAAWAQEMIEQIAEPAERDER
jgi:rubrerythrin